MYHPYPSKISTKHLQIALKIQMFAILAVQNSQNANFYSIFPCQKWHFWAKFSLICVFLPKYGSPCQKNVFWGPQAHKTHPNNPQTKGFALKHHQNDSRQLFWKVKFWHFFQNFIFQKWEFSFWFYAGNESWKCPKLNFAKKSRFNDGEVIFWQTLLDLDYFGCVLSIYELRIEFWSIPRRIFGPKIKKSHFSMQKMAFLS